LTVSPPKFASFVAREQAPMSTQHSREPFFWAARASRGGSAAVVVAPHRIARRRAAEERATRFSSASDDKVGGFPARFAARGSEAIKRGKNVSAGFSSVRRRAISDARTPAVGEVVCPSQCWRSEAIC
jgi:hypothetical protein